MTQVSTQTKPTRVLIVGGVAGGASVAARLRRLSENVEIVLIERGPDVSFANCGLPYHIGETIKDRRSLLVQTPESLRRRFNLNVLTRTQVTAIDASAKQVTVRDLASNQERREAYDILVLSPGSEPIRPPLDGINLPAVMTLRNLADMDAIKARVDQGNVKHALIVGGGYIGLEMAEALRQRQLAVTLVELSNQVMNVADAEMAVPLHNELKANGVTLKLNTSVLSFHEKEGGGVNASLSTGEELATDLVILAIGVKPEAKLARDAGLAIGPRGGIVVDEHMRTSDPSIFALGDAVEVKDFVSNMAAVIPLAGPANRQGRIVADNIAGRPTAYRKTQGTAICKVFSLAIGMTGLSEKALRKLNLPFEKIYVHPASHASYYPNAQPISLKLLFHPTTGQILGAQAVGVDGVDKRIDVLATAIRANMTVYDLENLELSYAPPYGSAKDPINYAAFAAANFLRGDVQLCHYDDVKNMRPDQVVLDVRTPAEVAGGMIPGAVHIPLDSLRQRLAELPRDKELLVNCQSGLRSYLACRILSQHGYKCRNFSGGWKTYSMCRAADTQTPTAPTPPERKTDMPVSNPTSTPASSAPSSPSVAATSSAATLQVHDVDASGQACPGPVLRLKEAIDAIPAGAAVRIKVTDAGFAQDLPAWCQSTGHQLLDITRTNGHYVALVKKQTVPTSCPAVSAANVSALDDLKKHKTMVVFSGDLDKALAAFIIANGAAAMGSKVTLFFTFWGLNILRKPNPPAVSKNLIERMFGWMMPRGAAKLKLSQMHMAGMGASMIKGIMHKHGVPSLPELIDTAKKSGVRLVVCGMSADLMGFKKEEFIDGIEYGGVASFLNSAEAGNVSLFI